MIRKLLNTSELQYVVDFYDAYLDMEQDVHYDKFVILRKFNMMNNIAEDTDIYIVERDVWDSYCNEEYDLLWPASDTTLLEYSENFEIFNNKYIKESFCTYDDNDEKINNIGSDVYELLDNTGKPIPIRCNKIRIYRPMNKRVDNYIIDITNKINNIKFHYMCRKNIDVKVDSYEQFSIENVTYSEYIELYFPNLQDLFGEDSKVYYIEDINLVYSCKNENFIDRISYDTKDGRQLVPFNLFIQPFNLVEENDMIVKQYLKISKSLENNSFTFPITTIVFPYFELDTYNTYIVNDDYPYNSCVFIPKYEISLKGRVDFSNNKISIVGEFEFPRLTNFVNDDKGSAIKKAYCHFNNVSEEMYENFSEAQKNLLFKDIDAMDIKELTQHNKNEVIVKYNLSGKLSNEEYFEKYKELKKAAIEEEYKESLETDIDFIGFKITVASDIVMSKIIWQNDYIINIKDLDNFAVDITSLYEDWQYIYKQPIAQITFIDRFLGIQYKSNYIFLTNENLKYVFLNPDSPGRINTFDRLNTVYNEKIQTNDMKYFKADDSSNNFSFLNNITCVVNNINTPENAVNSFNSTRVLYKPIFYRTNDAQNVRIRNNVTQKIGINLAQYMTKVETFKIVLDGNIFQEYGRNDVYVIFNVIGSTINTRSGSYDVKDQDDEYITSGTYQIY